MSKERNGSVQHSALGLNEPFVVTTSDRIQVQLPIETVAAPDPEYIEPEIVLSKDELDQQFSGIHGRITALFYDRKEMTKEAFEALHAACWLYHQKALIEHGHEKDYSVQEEPWHSPKTRMDEIDEHLKHLNLRREDWYRHGCHDPKEFLPKKDKP
jgi:hypothetical protein